MTYLAAIAVDKRQHYILSADKLKEMVGASELIRATVEHARKLCVRLGVDLVRPVSGDIWVRAADLDRLQTFLFEFRQQLVDRDELQVTFAVIKDEYPGPREAYNALEAELRRQKANRETADDAPSSPYFARCNVQPELPANLWRPDNKYGRRRVSLAADRKRSKADGANPVPGEFLEPTQMMDMAFRQSNSYAAFLKSDVDGLGRIQIDAPWSEVAAHFQCTADEVVCRFSMKIEDSVRRAVQYASERAQPTDRKYWPVLPLVQAGDDLWLVLRREIGLQFAVDCGTEFTHLCNEDELVQAVTVNKPLTLSFGILFAKVGFPMDRQLDLADELLANAKKRRRESPKNLGDGEGPEGFLDYHWLDSSGYEDLRAARRQAEYRLPLERGAGNYRLYTRPWTLTQTWEMIAAGGDLAEVPARKLHQLAPILRMGAEFTRAGLQQWWRGLRDREREAVDEALKALPEKFRIPELDSPWHEIGKQEWATALTELFELREIQAKGEANEPH